MFISSLFLLVTSVGRECSGKKSYSFASLIFKPFANFAFLFKALKTAYPSSDPISKKVLPSKFGIKFNLTSTGPPSPIVLPPDGKLNVPLKLNDLWFDPKLLILNFSLTSKNPYNDQNSFDETIEVNLKGAFNLCSNYCLNLNSTNSSVINITSLGANQAFPKNPSYQASKSGLKQLTKAFALDFANKKIRFNSICPGYIKTKMTEKSYSDASQRNNRTSRMMMNRWGNVDDILGGVIYLLSDSSSYVTGTELTIDGGWLNKGL